MQRENIMKLLNICECLSVSGAFEAKILDSYWNARNAYNDIYFNGAGMVAANESKYGYQMAEAALALVVFYPESYHLEPFSSEIHNSNPNVLANDVYGYAVVKI